MLTAKPIQPINMLVTEDDLEVYLNQEQDFFFFTAIKTASEYFVKYTGIELGLRDSKVTGTREQRVYSGLSPVGIKLADWVEIPIYPVTEVKSLEIDGETVTPEIDFDKRPHLIKVGNAEKVEMVVTAGHAQGTVDESIKMAILMLAGFIVEHRGACDLTDAAILSGAQLYLDQQTIRPIQI